MSLSKTQSYRLGGLLAVMANDEIDLDLIKGSIEDGFVIYTNGRLKLSEDGLSEKNRLCTLAGLNIKYKSEGKKCHTNTQIAK